RAQVRADEARRPRDQDCLAVHAGRDSTRRSPVQLRIWLVRGPAVPATSTRRGTLAVSATLALDVGVVPAATSTHLLCQEAPPLSSEQRFAFLGRQSGFRPGREVPRSARRPRRRAQG